MGRRNRGHRLQSSASTTTSTFSQSSLLYIFLSFFNLKSSLSLVCLLHMFCLSFLLAGHREAMGGQAIVLFISGKRLRDAGLEKSHKNNWYLVSKRAGSLGLGSRC